MVTFIRVRNIQPGQYANAVAWLKKYKDFAVKQGATGLRFGAEVGRVGRIVSMVDFEDAKTMEDALNQMRGDPKYAELLDESAAIFDGVIDEHLILELPV